MPWSGDKEAAAIATHLLAAALAQPRQPKPLLKIIGGVLMALGIAGWAAGAVLENPLGWAGALVAFVGLLVLIKGFRG